MCRPLQAHNLPVLMPVKTPLHTHAWETALSTHPDRAFARYVVNGLQTGFRIGFQRQSPLRSATANMESARQHPEVVQKYIDAELSKGRMLGPFTPGLYPSLHISRFGVIPKGHNTGKWRLITDLSYPEGQSVNDGIEPAWCTLSYTTVDAVAEIIATLGRGALLAKIDIESAYRLIPVHPQDRVLQAVQWGEGQYVDPMLPFGLRSAPKIFNAVADGLDWFLHQSGIAHCKHYLDDFIIIGPPDTADCSHAVAILDAACGWLGVPIAEHKRDGPTTCLTFLGIEIDTTAGELRLPTDKMERLESLLKEWGDRKACSRRELESLVGLLNHACKVVRPGRSFLRRMLDLLHSTGNRPGRGHIIRLNTGFRADLAWWREFVHSWNGTSFLLPPEKLPSVEIASDASGSWGCAAWYGQSWFQVQWDEQSEHLDITCKELVPVILACAVWGQEWAGYRVICHCDNQAVVACLHSRSSRQKELMHMLRCLVFIEAHLNCHLYPMYINTRNNHIADDLSRNNLFSFFSKVPDASHSPAQVSRQLLQLLLNPQADWTSRQWRRQFRSTLTPA